MYQMIQLVPICVFISNKTKLSVMRETVCYITFLFPIQHCKWSNLAIECKNRAATS